MGKFIKWPKNIQQEDYVLPISRRKPVQEKNPWVPHVEAARARLPSGSLTTFVQTGAVFHTCPWIDL